MSVLELIFFPCPHCKKFVKMIRKWAGKKAVCKNCRNSVDVPGPWEKVMQQEIQKQEAFRRVPDIQQEMQTIQNGEMKTIQCRHDPEQLYLCYLPTQYNPAKKHPILYCLFPGKHLTEEYCKKLFSFFKEPCEKSGWIAVCSRNAKSNVYSPVDANMITMKAVFADTHQRFSIASKRCYACGIAGCSSIGFRIASMYPDSFSGVIPISTGNDWSQNVVVDEQNRNCISIILPTHVAIFFIAASEDESTIVEKTCKMCEQKGHKTEMRILRKNQNMLADSEFIQDALVWFEKLAKP